MSTTLKVPVLLGIDERLQAPPESAKVSAGWRYDSVESRWVHDRGYRAYFSTAPQKGQPADGYGTHSIAVHTTRGGATQDIILEVDTSATTTSLVRIAPWETGGKITLASARHRPGVTDPGSCIVSLGYAAMVCNGWDKPLRTYPVTSSTPRVEQYGYPERPAALQANTISDSDPGMKVAGDYKYATSADYDDITVAYPHNNTIGLGNGTASSPNAYRYVYTWVSDTGSESPISAPSSVVSWNTYADAFRYGITLTGIQAGPAGTIKRRIYRTKNLGSATDVASATYYFVAELPDNYSTYYTDHVPDGLLSSVAPTDLESAPLPADIRWATVWAGRTWIVSGDYRVHWSQPGAMESFGTASYVDVSSRVGGRVTGLIGANDLLLILRERAIDAVVNVNGTFRATTLTTDIGSIAPHAAIAVPGYGTVIVANDGIYAIQGNLSGGGTWGYKKISAGLTATWARVNTGVLAKAWAWHNDKDHEVIFALPVDGSTYPNLQVVLHLEVDQQPAWTLRNGVQATCGVGLPGQFPLMGGHGYNYTEEEPVLLSVWQAVDQYGYVANTLAARSRETAVWESNDMDLSDPTKSKDVKSVTLTITKGGSTAIRCKLYKDGEYTNSTPTQTSIQNLLDAPWVTTYGPVTTNQQAVIGTSAWSVQGLADIRYDAQTFSAHRYKVRFESDSVCAIHAYTVSFDESARKAYQPNLGGTNVPDRRK